MTQSSAIGLGFHLYSQLFACNMKDKDKRWKGLFPIPNSYNLLYRSRSKIYEQTGVVVGATAALVGFVCEQPSM